MFDSDNRDTFDRLVSDLNADERHEMLGRINKNSPETVQFVTTEDNNSEPKISLQARLNKESFFYRFFLWLKSIFFKRSTTTLYNEDLLSNIAKKINHEHPGLINHNNMILDSIFYDRLCNLKNAADFFKPYFSFVENSLGDFYVFLSSFVVPELNDSIKQAVDPFNLSFSKNPTLQLKTELVHKLDEILNSMNTNTRSALYYAISSLNWLKLYTKLPFIHFTSQFTNITGENYTCPYSNALQDYNIFASVFSDIKSISNESLEALYLFSQKKELSKNVQEKDIEKAIKEFMTVANGHLATIQMFISGVPIVKVGKLINFDYEWEPSPSKSSEAWFPTFRNQWKKNLDLQWNNWIRERQKALLTKKLENDFQLQQFPVMQQKPWTKMWMDIPFSYELTGGFISWFATNQYDKIITPLNEVMLEGIFINNENRKEFSEGLDSFSIANKQMLDLLEKLSPNGMLGSVFADLSSNKLKTLNVQKQIDSMMISIESEIREILEKFKNGAIKIDNVLKGFFEQTRDGTHEPLQNWNSIKGHLNREWHDNLREIYDIIKKSIFYISELEPIDAETLQNS